MPSVSTISKAIAFLYFKKGPPRILLTLFKTAQRVLR